MTTRSVVHATFTIARIYPAKPARVFKAWGDPAGKARWFAGEANWKTGALSLDFRVGGREHLTSIAANGVAHIYAAVYWDIVPDQRIVYSYDMHLGETRISVSLATVELQPEGDGTRLIFTEQGAFLDGYDDSGSRERGTGYLLDSLGVALERQTAIQH
jgi:uncharacterized protein YndB with AHSA1/START domain